MLLLCHLPDSPGGGEAALLPGGVIKVVYVFMFVCSGEKTDCILCAWVMPRAMCQENVGHFTCLHLDKTQGANKKSKRPHSY